MSAFLNTMGTACNSQESIDNIKSKKLSIRFKEPSQSSPTIQQPSKIAFKLKPQSVIDATPVVKKYSVYKEPVRRKEQLWTEKYRPTNLNSIIGSAEQVASVRDWFDKYMKDDPTIERALLFTGNPGTSKTSVAYAIMNEYKFRVIEFNASDVRNKKQIKENMDNILYSMKLLGNVPIGIIMDEIDGISTGDKGGLTELLKVINPSKSAQRIKIPPIICICNDKSSKKMEELRNSCREIKFDKPDTHVLAEVISNVAKLEGLHIIDSYSVNTIALEAQGDFRRLMYILQNLFAIYGTSPINKSSIIDCLMSIKDKTVHMNSFDIANKIFGRSMTLEEVKRVYELDKCAVPMMIHENYNRVIDSMNTSQGNKHRIQKKFIDATIQGDIFDKIMYTSQKWHLQPVHCLTTCYLPNRYINDITIASSTGGGSGNKPKCKWTTALGKFSHHKANYKNVNSIIRIMSTGLSYRPIDIQFLSEIILDNLLVSNNVPRCIEIMKSYNLSADDIEKLRKVNKLTTRYKDIFKSRHKTLLSKAYPTPSTIRSSIIYNNKKDSANHLPTLASMLSSNASTSKSTATNSKTVAKKPVQADSESESDDQESEEDD